MCHKDVYNNCDDYDDWWFFFVVFGGIIFVCFIAWWAWDRDCDAQPSYVTRNLWRDSAVHVPQIVVIPENTKKITIERAKL